MPTATYDEALLWLNGHLGETVTVYLVVGEGELGPGGPLFPLAFVGELQHHTESESVEALQRMGETVELLRGMYQVDRVHLVVHERLTFAIGDDQLQVTLADGVRLSITVLRG